MKEYIFDAVIIGGGEYPTAEQPLKVIKGAPYIVCCDGATNREKFSHLLHIISEQESNDQTKAVRFCMEQGKKRIAIVGATGKREDHTIGNISLLIEYARAGVEVFSFTDYGMFIPCNGTTTHRCRKGQQVSIFSITAKNMSAEGLLYPIYDFNNWWQGTLNECTGEEFTINAEKEYLLFLNY